MLINFKEALNLETKVSQIISEQERHGVLFDMDKAEECIDDLSIKLSKIEEDLQKYFKLEVDILETRKENREYGYVSKTFLKNGQYNSSILKHYGDESWTVEGPFSRIRFFQPSLSQTQIIKNQLLKLGWKPTSFTAKGSPQLTIDKEPCPNLEKVGDFGKSLALFFTLQHRRSQIEGLFNHIFHREGPRLPAQAINCATNTGRVKHKIVANIPRVSSIYGSEMRSLFCVPYHKRMVGMDVAGLELRMFAHYLNDPEYTHQILEGDIHTFNQHAAGLETRDQAKTFIYALLYGAQATKMGRIVGGGKREGEGMMNKFFAMIPKYKKVTDQIKAYATKHGYVPGIDGRALHIRKNSDGKIQEHTALNTLLQGGGSIITKRAMVIANEEIKRKGLDAHQVIFYHDEFDFEVEPEDVEELKEILLSSIIKAGEYYKLRIPMKGDVKIGRNWKEIH